jgi:hypothetical protein
MDRPLRMRAEESTSFSPYPASIPTVCSSSSSRPWFSFGCAAVAEAASRKRSIAGCVLAATSRSANLPRAYGRIAAAS